MICDLSFITGYGKKCPKEKGCVWWNRYCKTRLNIKALENTKNDEPS